MDFSTSPLQIGGVLWFHVGSACVRMSVDSTNAECVIATDQAIFQPTERTLLRFMSHFFNQYKELC